MIRYDRMYCRVFNALTDAREVTERMPPSPEREQLREILDTAQAESEEIYLQGEEAKLTEIFPPPCFRDRFGVK